MESSLLTLKESPKETPIDFQLRVNTEQLQAFKKMIRACYQPPSLQVCLQELHSSGGASDVLLKVQSNAGELKWSFPAHRFILASRCQYFQHVLTSSFTESVQREFELPQNLFRDKYLCDDVMGFIYLGSINQTLKVSKDLKSLVPLADLYSCADFLGLISLEELLVKEMKAFMHGMKCACNSCSDFASTLLSFADRMHISGLSQSLISLFSQFPRELWIKPDFMTLSSELHSQILDTFITNEFVSPDRLMNDVINIDYTLETLNLRCNNPGYISLVDQIAKLANLLHLRLIDRFPEVLRAISSASDFDRCAKMDMLRKHVLEKLNESNAVAIASALYNATSPLEHRGFVETDSELFHLSNEACDYVAKRWMNVSWKSTRIGAAKIKFDRFVKYIASRCHMDANLIFDLCQQNKEMESKMRSMKFNSLGKEETKKNSSRASSASPGRSSTSAASSHRDNFKWEDPGSRNQSPGRISASLKSSINKVCLIYHM
jgi:hypothetical protein